MHYGEQACAGARGCFVRLAAFWQVSALHCLAGILVLALSVLASTPSLAQVQYRYDELGRLIQVVAPDGQSAQYTYDAAGNITSIKKLAATAISISEFTPNGGPIGATVTLYGTGFNTTPASNSVKFNGAPAAVSAATATSLTVNVPAAATTGVLTVTNANGTATSVSSFVVGVTTPAPTITSFTPNIGTQGTVVTVTGTNFQLAPEDNKAIVGAMSAAVLKDASSPTATQLKLTVPTEAASGKISVTTPYGKANSSSDFYALPSTVNPADFEFKGRLVVNGSAVNVTTTASGKKAVLLFDATSKQGLHLVTTAGTFAVPVSVAVYAPNGRQVQTLSLSNIGVVDFSASVIGVETTGTYTVILTPEASDKGTLSLSLVADVTGSLTLDAAAATTVNIARAGQNGNYTFYGSAGQLLSVVLSNNTLDDGVAFSSGKTSLRLFKAGDYLSASIGTIFISTDRSGGTIDATLPETGFYTVHVDPVGMNKGSVDLQVKSYATGTLTVDGSTSINLSSGRNARYSFTAEAGKGYGLAISGLTFTPAGGWLRATLRKADGTAITWCDFNASNSCDFTPQYFATAGTYIVDFDPGLAFAASFNAVSSKDVAGTLAVDAAAATTVTTVREGQNARYTFNGAAGQLVSVVLSGNTLEDGNATTNNQTQVTLYKTSNAVTAIGFANLATGTPSGTFDATLPETGTYTLYVGPGGLDKGSIGVQVKSYAGGTLTVDGSTAVNLSEGRNARYSFTAEAGKGYGLALTGLTFTPAGGSVLANLRKADGTFIRQCNFSASGSCDFAPRDFVTAGTYLIDFDPQGNQSTVFNAVLSKDVAGILAVDAAASTTVTTLREGQNARYTFSGTAGQSVSVVLSGKTMDDGNAATSNQTRVEVYKPSDAVTAIGFAELSYNTTGGTIDFTLPDAGIYTVFVNPSALDKGSIGVHVKSYATGTLVVDGSTAVNLSAGRNALYGFTAEAGKGYGLAASALVTSETVSSVATKLKKADGSVLASCSLTTRSNCRFRPTLFATAGTYYVEFDPPGISTASFNAVLSKDIEGVVVVDATSSTVINITRPGQSARYTVSGTAGSSVNLQVIASTLDDGNSTTYPNDTYIRVSPPSNLDAQTAYLTLFAGSTSGSVKVVFAETGIHTIWVNPGGLDVGSLSFKVANASDQTGTLPVDGAAVPVSLGAGVIGKYTFTAEAGKGYAVALKNFTSAMYMNLRSPTGVVLANRYVSSTSRSTYFSPTNFTVAGTYTIEFLTPSSGAVAFDAVLSKDLSGVVVLDGVTPNNIAINREGQMARYSFSGTAGQKISILISNVASLSMAAPSSPGNSLSPSTYLPATPNSLFDFTLLETGSYSLTTGLGDLNKGVIALQIKTTQTGTLAVDASTAMSLSAGRNAQYSFSAEAGKGYGLAVGALTFSPVGGTLAVKLRKPDGTLLTTCDFSEAGSCNFAPTLFAVAGTYQIEFNPAGLNAASFNAVLSKDAAGTLTVDAASPTTMTIARPGQNARYTFSGTAGQSLSVTVVDNTSDATNPTASSIPVAYLYKPSDATNYVTGVAMWYGGDSLDLQLPETGTYTLFIDAAGMDTGTFTAHVRTDQAGTLVVDGNTAISIPSGRKARYTFTAEAGKGYGIALLNPVLTPATTARVEMRLLKSDGTVVPNFCSDSFACDFYRHMFPTAGTYTIEFNPPALSSASFTAVLNKDLAGTLTVGAVTPTTINFTRAGQNASYTFSGTAGQTISLLFSNNTIDDGNATTNPYTNIDVYAPSNISSPFSRTGIRSASSTPSLADVVLPETGVYTLHINPGGVDKGSIGLRVINK